MRLQWNSCWRKRRGCRYKVNSEGTASLLHQAFVAQDKAAIIQYIQDTLSVHINALLSSLPLMTEYNQPQIVCCHKAHIFSHIVSSQPHSANHNIARAWCNHHTFSPPAQPPIPLARLYPLLLQDIPLPRPPKHPSSAIHLSHPEDSARPSSSFPASLPTPCS